MNQFHYFCNVFAQVLVFKERGKLEYPEKNLSEQGREPTTNSTHIMASMRGFKPGPHWWEASVLTTAPPLLIKGHYTGQIDPKCDSLSSLTLTS